MARADAFGELRIARPDRMQKPERARVETPEFAEDRDDPRQRGVRIGYRHGVDQPMQAAAHRHRVEYGFQYGPARPELIVDGQARHARSLRDGLERKLFDTF